jgi:hypothetical protein
MPLRRPAQRITQAMPQMLRTSPLVPPQGMARQQNTRPLLQRKEVSMTVTIPLVAIAGIVVYLAYRYMGLRMWHAIVALIFGFLLAATTAAPAIQNFLNSLTRSVNKP